MYVECRSTSPGHGSYYYRWKQDGKTRHKKLGTTTEISLDEARERAKVLKAEITLGLPITDKQTSNSIPTFHDYFNNTYMVHAKAHCRGHRKKQQMYNLRLKNSFGNCKLDKIRAADVSTWHVSLRESGLSPAYSDRFLALLRHALNMAVAWELLEKNPAANVKQFNPDNRNEQHLSEAELKRLLKVLQTDKNRTVCLIILTLVATGARLNEVLQAKWQDIDRENAVWRIPESVAKSRRSELIPLNSFVTDQILGQLDTEGKHQYLFVNSKTKKAYTTIFKSWKRISALAGLPDDFKLHSLRRSYASLVVSSGHSLYQASRLLRHSNPNVTADRYAVLTSNSLRSATESVADALNEALKDDSDSASRLIQGAMKKSA
jgi:integrase